jgi:cytidylate kinase
MHISIAGEIGAGCTEVGQILKEKLGYKCVSSADIIRSIVVDFRGVHPDESFSEFEHHIKSGEVELDKMIDSHIDDILELGPTIVEGRSAFMLLDNTDVLKVLLVSPYEIRVKRVSSRRNISIKEATETIRSSDAERRHMVEKLFNKNWRDPHNYHIVINTHNRSFKETARIILETLQVKE